MSSNKFTIYCAHRSGSNYLDQLIRLNTEGLKVVESNRGSVEWKHGTYWTGYKNDRKFNCLIARNPAKWVNGCISFNADMWKWWGVNANERSFLTFDYKNRIVSIVYMMNKWNKYYNDWLDNSDCYFVWYPDLLDPVVRDNILDNIIRKYGLTRTTTETVIPTNVQHSENYNNEKTKVELDLTTFPNLTDLQLKYINDVVDVNLIKKMSERREYENSGSIQWPA